MLKQWSVESLTLRIEHYTYKSVRANSALDTVVGQNKPEECKYPTALVDKERSSDNTV